MRKLYSVKIQKLVHWLNNRLYSYLIATNGNQNRSDDLVNGSLNTNRIWFSVLPPQ